ncbi:MAG: hypothetical protein VR73_15225 [Gammaproteobacteria bacterium BRH_c0]|nr:MAG: hypothetical protein VR73_15225 [Gammaproteobacteria bacterium BRH_c0]
MSNNSTARFGDADLWIRLVYMILFAFLSVVSRFVICLTGLVQFVLVLFSGEDNYRLRSFGNSLSRWTYDAYRFITFNSEQKPFPFMDWPEEASTVVETAADPQADVPTVTDVIAAEENEHPDQEPKA